MDARCTRAFCASVSTALVELEAIAHHLLLCERPARGVLDYPVATTKPRLPPM